MQKIQLKKWLCEIKKKYTSLSNRNSYLTHPPEGLQGTANNTSEQADTTIKSTVYSYQNKTQDWH